MMLDLLGQESAGRCRGWMHCCKWLFIPNVQTKKNHTGVFLLNISVLLVCNT